MGRGCGEWGGGVVSGEGCGEWGGGVVSGEFRAAQLQNPSPMVLTPPL